MYGTTAELARILQLSAPSPAQEAALGRVLEATATEIDNELGLAAPLGEPYPALVLEVSYERAVEHWKQEQSPFGIVVLGAEGGAAYTSRNSWRRHSQTLRPLKEGSWGVG